MRGGGLPVRVKICGIRRLEDALLGARLGADAIGVLVGQRHPSADFLAPGAAAPILRGLPPLVSGVLVSHCSSAAELEPLIALLQPAAVQLQSAIEPEQVQQLRAQWPSLTLLKVAHVNGPLRRSGAWFRGRQQQPQHRPGGRHRPHARVIDQRGACAAAASAPAAGGRADAAQRCSGDRGGAPLGGGCEHRREGD